MDHEIFQELADRTWETASGGVKQIQPWCRWQGLSEYLDCVAFADRMATEIPTGRALDLTHVTPGRFYSVAIVFFAQALIDNLAVWLCDASSLPVSGGDRHFLSRRFKRELAKKWAHAAAVLTKHESFLEDTNKYRQVWIHTISGGAVPSADVNPFEYPDTEQKFLGVPIDPAVQPHLGDYSKRAEECARKNDGRYLYPIGDFTLRLFEATTALYMDWLRFSLDHITA